MKLKFLRNITVDVFYTWYCGDGCCSNDDYDYIDLKAGEVLELTPSGYRPGDWTLEGMYHDNEYRDNFEPLFIYDYTVENWIEDEFCEILNEVK